jgi:hypothetical protein
MKPFPLLLLLALSSIPLGCGNDSATSEATRADAGRCEGQYTCDDGSCAKSKRKCPATADDDASDDDGNASDDDSDDDATDDDASGDDDNVSDDDATDDDANPSDDDAADDAGSGGGGEVGANDDGTGAPIELATLPDYSTADNAAFLDGVVGEHSVAIFRVPEGMESWIGEATLSIEHSGDGFAAELIAANGDTVSQVDSSDAINAMLTPIIGQVFVFRDSSIEGYLNIAISSDGLITGAAGGFGEVAFRNDITAYGAAVPTAFSNLQGTYHGYAQALTCDQPPVTVTLKPNGSITLTGSYNLACEEDTIVARWDGNDDFIVPAPTGYNLALDSQKGGGSAEGGGITVTFDSLDPDALLTHVTSTGSGSLGNIESDSLVKEGVLPTQDQFTLRMVEGQTFDVDATGDVDQAPWDMDNTTLTITETGELSFAGTTFAFGSQAAVEGTTDQKMFRFQAIYMSVNLIFVELTFQTDGTLLGGTFGGAGMGTLMPQ